MESIDSFVAGLILQGGGAVDVVISKNRRSIVYSMPDDTAGVRRFLRLNENNEASCSELEQHINKIMCRTVH